MHFPIEVAIEYIKLILQQDCQAIEEV
jgi:hypothetical protein